ncbi:IS66 family transposase [Ralstonia sp. A12]|uniref:IS66 family transposase n=1 Tax=Ralstonia sp. A12 TaxID=1217052 RepID=UPI0006937AA7|nr:transposase [Ralstonia sp. A12]
MTERLDIVPAEFFVHCHIYGKWACRCCQVLRQAPSVAEVIEGGIAASGLLAHTLISRFVDHLPYYRQETINACSGVHTPCSTLAALSGQAGAALEPLFEVHKRFILSCRVLHADETPVALLDPGASKTRRAYVWAYARNWHNAGRAWSTSSARPAGRSTRSSSWRARGSSSRTLSMQQRPVRRQVFAHSRGRTRALHVTI